MLVSCQIMIPDIIPDLGRQDQEGSAGWSSEVVAEVAQSFQLMRGSVRPQLAAGVGKGTGVLRALAPLSQGCPEGESSPILGMLLGMPLLCLAKGVHV